MKRKFFTTALMVCCFMVCFAIVTGLTGKWAGTLKTPDGNEIPLSYNFKMDSGKITGTAESPEGTGAIDDGKIDGNNFTFKVTVAGVEYMHTCKFYEAADSVGVDITSGDVKLHTTLKRSEK